MDNVNKTDNPREKESSERILLMVLLCNQAGALAIEAAQRGEEPNISKAFEEALAYQLADGSYTKNDLVNVWAMLLLAAQGVKTVVQSTAEYVMGAELRSEYTDPGS